MNKFDELEDEIKLAQHLDATEKVVLAILAAEEVDPDSMPLWKVAQAFNVSAQVVEQWVKAGMPRNPDGAFSWAAVMEWKSSGIKRR